MAPLTEAQADSNVDMLAWMLTEQTPDEHAWEMDEEAWDAEMGDRAAMYLAAAGRHDGARMSFFMAICAWAYRRDPGVLDGLDGLDGGGVA